MVLWLLPDSTVDHFAYCKLRVMKDLFSDALAHATTTLTSEFPGRAKKYHPSKTESEL